MGVKALVTANEPTTYSEVPETCFVRALIDKSTPWVNGLNTKGVAHELSILTKHFGLRSLTYLHIALTSSTSKVLEQGDSK